MRGDREKNIKRKKVYEDVELLQKKDLFIDTSPFNPSWTNKPCWVSDLSNDVSHLAH